MASGSMRSLSPRTGDLRAHAVGTVARMTRQIIRFDTTNPPGAEAACVNHIAKLLADLGLDVRIIALDDTRPNLIARSRPRVGATAALARPR